ncbi:MAG: hypothetical protein IJB11_04335 [Oscillospiraceae bacterium]|nr:hypothetical protein [Oscillospiraceae bacterium]
MIFSYRTRKRLINLGITILVLLLVAAIVWLCGIIWLDRYVVYSRSGARIDFNQSPTFPSGVVAKPTVQNFSVNIFYDEPEIEAPVVDVMPTSISGYYIDSEALKTDIPAVLEQVQKLEKDTAVLLDVKDIRGHFYYSSSVSTKRAKDVDIEQMNQLIQYLLESDLYLIARLPALRDYEFGLNNVPCGLPRKGGNGSLWLDDTNCYWLDPTKSGTLDYLAQQAMELRLMGFNEVVFTDFRFPNTEKITFEGDKEQAIAEAAATLVQKVSADKFFLSFHSETTTFSLPEGNCRLYLADVPAADVSTIVEQIGSENPAIQMMFLTTVHDTRFDEYCVLRPLDEAP